MPEQTSIPYSSLDYPGGGGGLIFIIVGFATLLSGLISLYGFLANRNILVRDSCRATAALFLLLAIFGTGWDDILGFVIIPLLFSGDLKRLWERILSNERIRQLIEKREFLGIDLRLLLLMGVIMFAIVIIIFETRAFWRSF